MQYLNVFNYTEYMPVNAQELKARSEIRTRGGAIKYRTKKLANGKYRVIAIVPKAGARGGHTVAGPERTKQHAG